MITLTYLLSYNLIHCDVKNVTLTSHLVEMYFEDIDLTIPARYLGIILGNGSWTGKEIEIPTFYTEFCSYYTTIAELKEDVSISIKDLYVYKRELTG